MKNLFLAAALALVGSIATAHATPLFVSGDGNDFVYHPGDINLLHITVNITPNPAWGDTGLGAKWISYAQTGDGGIIAPDVAARLPQDATAIFLREFHIGSAENFNLRILADDTADVYLINLKTFAIDQLFHAYQGQINPCAGGGEGHPVGCVQADMGNANLILGKGDYVLVDAAYQTGGGPFGTEYTAQVPEPATLALLGTGLLGAGLFGRCRKSA